MSTTLSLSQSLRGQPVVVERYITLTASSATNVGVSVPANSVVLSAGIEILAAVPDITTYTANITDGTTTFASGVVLDAAPAVTFRVCVTPGFVASADTIDVVTTISGSPGTIPVRVFAVVVNVNDSVRPGAAAARDNRA